MITQQQCANSNTFSKSAAAMAVALMCFASANAKAQVSTITTRDGAIVSTTAPKASTVIPDANPKVEEALPASVSVIYSNFGTGSNLYNGGTGWTEAGAEANDFPVAEAMSFVPDSNYILVRIDAAFSYVEGTNGMKLVLAEDNGGVPGQILYAAPFSNVPEFGTCCTIQTVTLSPTKGSFVGLASGKTYWLYPVTTSDGYLVWNYDTTNKGGSGAVSRDYGKSWTSTSLLPFGAFSVYGVKSAR